MIVYISGPMTGLPDHNYPAFNAAAKYLRDLGHQVVNPAELSTPSPEKEWHHYMRDDIKAMMDCDSIYLLPGWTNSKGARLEYHIAVALGFRLFGEKYTRTTNAIRNRLSDRQTLPTKRLRNLDAPTRLAENPSKNAQLSPI